MAKSLLRIKARNLRSKGESVKEISKKLYIAKSTVSLWVRDIILSVEQLEKLKQRSIKGGELGRLKGALMQKNRRLELVMKYREQGIKRLKNISENEFFVAGLALYWAEGSKKRREVSICNSDPDMINFMIVWLKKFFSLPVLRLKAVVGINYIHKDREEEVKKYWSAVTGIPLEQFRKTSFKKTNNKKIYSNFKEHFGTLSIKVLKSADICYKILGFIDGLARQGSSMAEHGIHNAAVVGSIPTPATYA